MRYPALLLVCVPLVALAVFLVLVERRVAPVMQKRARVGLWLLIASNVALTLMVVVVASVA